MNMRNKTNTNEIQPKECEERWFFRGEIYYAELCDAEGSEQKKLRPVVIIQNNLGNRYSPNVIVAGISSVKTGEFANKIYPTQMLIMLDRESVIMCEQIRTLSKYRLKGKAGELTSEQIVQLDDCLMKSLGLKWIS